MKILIWMIESLLKTRWYRCSLILSWETRHLKDIRCFLFVFLSAIFGFISLMMTMIRSCGRSRWYMRYWRCFLFFLSLFSSNRCWRLRRWSHCLWWWWWCEHWCSCLFRFDISIVRLLFIDFWLYIGFFNNNDTKKYRCSMDKYDQRM